MTNKIYITNEQKAAKIPAGTNLLIRRACTAALKHEDFPLPCEISVIIVDNKKIHEINLEQRGVDSPTDVLSFPQYDITGGEEPEVNPENGLCPLGDIVLSAEKAVEQSEAYGHSFRREIAYLTVHSMLHLLGYDHIDGGIEQVHMREHEERIMKQLGLPKGMSYVIDEK